MLQSWANFSTLEKLLFSQESQAVLCWVFGGTEFGREKHLQLSSAAWQAYPARFTVCSVVEQLVQASVEVLCVWQLMWFPNEYKNP